MGIETLHFGLGDNLTPKTSLQQLQQQSDIRHTFNDWLQSIHYSGRNVQSRFMVKPTQVPILHQFENVVVDDDLEDEFVEPSVGKGLDKPQSAENRMDSHEIEPVRIGMEDIQDEIDFWNS